MSITTVIAFIAAFCTASVLKVAIVNIVGGALFGYNIGVVPIYLEFDKINTNCEAYTANDACSNAQFANCAWNGTFCHFSDGVECGAFNMNTCESKSQHCQWNHDDAICKHQIGLDAVFTGIFAGAMIVGGFIASFAIGPITARIGRKKSMMLLAAIGTVASILMSVSRAANSYPLLVVARILIGLACGGACVVCPMYVDEMAPEHMKKPVGVLFQVSCTFGIMFAALLGLAMNPTDFSTNVHMESRIQVLWCLSTVMSLGMIILGLVVKESDVWIRQMGMEGETTPMVDKEDGGGDDSPPGTPSKADREQLKYTWSSMMGPLLIAVALSVAQQMTGINAIMNYAPNITKAAGLKPLVGNFVVMLWNFVTTLVSIPLSSKFSMRQMFLTGTLIASIACLFTGIPVYPGTGVSDDARHVLAGVGIFVFIAAFEIGMGPCFFVLCQDLFPSSFRASGAGFTVGAQFVFNIIINICFPIAVQDLSGGVNGDQNKGMGIVFMFFGGCGLAAFVVMLKFMHPWGSKVHAEIQ